MKSQKGSIISFLPTLYFKKFKCHVLTELLDGGGREKEEEVGGGGGGCVCAVPRGYHTQTLGLKGCTKLFSAVNATFSVFFLLLYVPPSHFLSQEKR